MELVTAFVDNGFNCNWNCAEAFHLGVFGAPEEYTGLSYAVGVAMKLPTAVVHAYTSEFVLNGGHRFAKEHFERLFGHIEANYCGHNGALKLKAGVWVCW